MSKIKYVLSSPHLRILYQSLIEPCLTYSCIIWLVLKKVLNLRFYINVKNLQLELSMVPSCNYNYVFYCAFFVCFILQIYLSWTLLFCVVCFVFSVSFFIFLCALYCCFATFWVNKDVYILSQVLNIQHILDHYSTN